MRSILSKLVVYKDLGHDSIVSRLADIVYRVEQTEYEIDEALEELSSLTHEFLQMATEYGYDGNLWHNHLAYLIANSETPFAHVCEMNGAPVGSVTILAKHDLQLISKLFNYDFKKLSDGLSTNIPGILCSYSSVHKDKKTYNHRVSSAVRELADKLRTVSDAPDKMFDVVTDFYKCHGVGLLGLNAAFRLNNTGTFCLNPITNIKEVEFADIIGYEAQKSLLIENTKAFVEGRPANNVLLYGDAGTGKSTSIKAVLNEFYPQGLRMIEIYKHQFSQLPELISMIKNRNYRFIIYMDDLSFEEFEIEYKYLKAVIEGGLENKPENVLIYATSNRRHLIRETWSDRSDMDDELHRSDTMQEKLSLVARFGLSIGFYAPGQNDYYTIVRGLAARHPEITLTQNELLQKASAWELSHGGRSGRTAEQFINTLLQ